MKYLFGLTAFGLFLFACKKEQLKSNNQHFAREIKADKILAELRDSISWSDFNSIDISRMYQSKDIPGGNLFIRLGLKNTRMETDFIILKADTAGKILIGKFIHIVKETAGKNDGFNGSIQGTSLNRKTLVLRKVINGRWQSRSNDRKPADQEPAGTQDLPPVVVTSFTNDGSYSNNWYLLDDLVDSYAGDGYYMYGSASGDATGNGIQDDETIMLETEPDEDTRINVGPYLSCFASLGNDSASFEISIYADIPVNGEPDKMFNFNTGSPGHSFIQLRKTRGSESVQQNIGFYPSTSWKTLTMGPVDSKLVNNDGHEYNASLTMKVNAQQFQAALDQLYSRANDLYDIDNWNCTDFAMSIFNAAAFNYLSIPKAAIPGSRYPGNTPQGLYNRIKAMVTNGETTFGTPEVPGVAGYVGASQGPCIDVQ